MVVVTGLEALLILIQCLILLRGRLARCIKVSGGCFTVDIAEASTVCRASLFAPSTSEKISHGQINAVSVLGLALDGTDLAGGSLGVVAPCVGFPLLVLKHHGS